MLLTFLILAPRIYGSLRFEDSSLSRDQLPDRIGLCESAPLACRQWESKFDICGVAGPHFTTNGPAVVINCGTNNHLFKIWSMILAVTTSPRTLAPITFKIDGCRVKKDKIKTRKKIPVTGKYVLLDLIF